MTALLNIWNQVAASESNLPDDELAELDPAAYQRSIARKAHEKEQWEAQEFDQHIIKVKAEQREREETAWIEAALIRADQWDHAMTDFGGRKISQAEAQEARQYAVDHRDEVVAQGIQNGQFRSEAEGQSFVDREFRLHELNEADRTAPLSEADRAERTALEQQQQPYSAVRGHNWEMALANRAPQPVAPSPTVGANDDNPYRARAPDMKASFEVHAGMPEEPKAQPLPVTPIPVPVAVQPDAMNGFS